MIQNWSLLLQDMDFSVRHKQGSMHRDADALSRKPHGRFANISALTGASFWDAYSAVAGLDEDDPFPDPVDESADVADPLEGEPTMLWPTDEEVSRMQQEDPFIGQIYRFLVHDEEPTDAAVSRMVHSKTNEFLVDKGKVYRVFHGPTQSLVPCLIVPPPLVDKVLYECHGHCFAGHLGYERTKRRLANRYWWPNMLKTVHEWIRDCPVCRAAKQRKTTHWPMPPIRVSRAFELVGMDVEGPSERHHCVHHLGMRGEVHC